MDEELLQELYNLYSGSTRELDRHVVMGLIEVGRDKLVWNAGRGPCLAVEDS